MRVVLQDLKNLRKHTEKHLPSLQHKFITSLKYPLQVLGISSRSPVKVASIISSLEYSSSLQGVFLVTSSQTITPNE